MIIFQHDLPFDNTVKAQGFTFQYDYISTG